MKGFQRIHDFFTQYRYSINTQQLGDISEYPWSNLGYWSQTQHYVEACCQLAAHLAEAVELNAHDRVLDLGCGQGASLLYWQQHYHVNDLEAVELQSRAVEKIKTHIEKLKKEQQTHALKAIHLGSFLELHNIPFYSKFDVVLCLDAAYHSALDIFLNSVTSVINSKGRLGFHYLMLSDQWQSLSKFEKKKYQLLLKAANVDVMQLGCREQYIQTLEQYNFESIQILDISEQVLYGFSQYAKMLMNQEKTNHLDFLKIKTTAKLCQRLYQDGLIQYVQMSAIQK